MVRGTRVPVPCPHGPRGQCRETGLAQGVEPGPHCQSCSGGAAWPGSDLSVTGSKQAEAEGPWGWNSHSGNETGSSSKALPSLIDMFPACLRVSTSWALGEAGPGCRPPGQALPPPTPHFSSAGLTVPLSIHRYPPYFRCCSSYLLLCNKPPQDLLA